MTEQKKSGRWKKGQSGNAAGRKPGTGEVAKLRAAIAERMPELLKVLTERALDGDVSSARLLLERTIAPLKATEELHPIPIGGGTLTEQGRTVLAAIADGMLGPGQGAAILASLGTLAKLTEVDDLERRIVALEARQSAEGSRN